MKVIAIDGPAGSGKSTVAAELAAHLGLPHVDTGAYYRAATLAVLRAQVDPADAETCANVIQGTTITRSHGRTLLDGEDVEDEIRRARVTAHVSVVSAHPQVRRALLELQRAEVGSSGAVVDGRDAGTAVVPDADLKVWLTASVPERAGRRATQLGEGGADALATHVEAIKRRDARDARQMRRARDALVIDTTGRTVASLIEELSHRVGTLE